MTSRQCSYIERATALLATKLRDEGCGPCSRRCLTLVPCRDSRFPEARVQRCQVQRGRNILCKLPEKARPVPKHRINKAFTAISHKKDVEHAEGVVALYRELFLEVMKGLSTDLEEVPTPLSFPEPHRKRI